MKNDSNKKHIGLWWKIPTGIIISLIGVIGIVLGGLNGLKYAIYSDFYAVMKKEGRIPGTNDGYVAQGIAVDEEKELTLLAGYQSNGVDASRINVMYKDGTTRYVEMLTEEGKTYIGHNSGIAIVKDKLWIADAAGSLVEVNYADVLDKNNKTVKIERTIPLNNNQAGLIFSYEDKVVIGEYSGYTYFPNNPYESNKNGLQHAIAEEYQIDDLEHPIRSFSLPNQVQGMAYNDEGDILLSISFGVSSSQFQFFKVDSWAKASVEHKNAPLYFLDDPTAILKGPAMSEDLDFSNGRFYTSSESASDKYIFGKFFFSDYYYSIAIDY